MSTKSITILFAICIGIFITSCKKEAIVNCTPVNHEILQGKWKHEFEEPKPGAFAHPTKFSFEFKSDSFFMSIHRVVDYLFPDEDCPGGTWTEYAKGIYTVSTDSLLLNGVYSESDFSDKEDGCYNIGMYNDTFLISNCESKLHLVWLSSNSGREIIMRLE